MSISHNLLGGNLFWLVLLGISLLATYSATRLTEAPMDNDRSDAPDSD